MKICVVGDDQDLSLAYLRWLGQRRGLETLVLNEEGLGLDWSFRMTENPESSWVEVNEDRSPINEICGAAVRLNPRPPVSSDLGVPEDVEHIYALERRYGLHWFLDEAPFTVVNRPKSGRSNGSKPYQMRQLERAGFSVPRWVVTNVADVATGFIASCHQGAVYKACSGLRSHVRLAGTELINRLKDGAAPVVLQEYIAGSDVRLHVVGTGTFATEIRTAAIDYRFDSSDTEYKEIQPPELLAQMCVDAAREQGLLLAGFDFRLTPDGSWWCLEANPVPTFLPYEAATGHPIGDTILNLLAPNQQVVPHISPLAGLSDESIRPLIR